ncbi:MAG: M14 family metallocarboxypeptidase [Clostridia bacterium]|nr:M14 family metallocarboxypeptidase [Clostridia bacterium]
MIVTHISTNYPADSALTYHYIKRLGQKYPFLSSESMGKSVLGRDITVLRLGFGPRRVFFFGAHHALEWITTLILLRFALDYCERKTRGGRFGEKSINEVFAETSAYVVPMVNPDGVDIVINGAASAGDERENVEKMLSGRDPSKVWQANARGVDLNHNYNARFDEGKRLEGEYGVTGPGPTRFGGPYYESEPETRAVCRFLRARRCELLLSLHTQGREIYSPGDSPESKAWLGELSRLSGYRAAVPEGIAACRGLCDWFALEFSRPAFTIEAGQGKNPLPLRDFDGIYAEVFPMLAAAVCGM